MGYATNLHNVTRKFNSLVLYMHAGMAFALYSIYLKNSERKPQC